MGDEPDWMAVLEYLYASGRSNVSGKRGGHGVVRRGDQLIQDVELSEEEIDTSVTFLVNSGLLDEEETEHLEPLYVLNPEGFRVVHERKMQRREQIREDNRAGRQRDTNLAVGWLTAALVVVSTIDTAVAAWGLEQPLWGRVLIVTGLTLALVTVLVSLQRAGLLEP